MSCVSNLIKYISPHFSEAQNACIPNEAIISLSQDDVDQLKPTVEKGIIVKEGQLIGLGKTLSASVHSPIPGTVEEIFNASMPNGKKSLAVKIKLNGSFTFLGKKNNQNKWQALSPSQLCRIFSDKGVINTFDYPVSLAQQVSTAMNNGSHVLAVRLFDIAPDYDTDGFIASNYLFQVLSGVAIIARVINASAVAIIYPQNSDLASKADMQMKAFFSEISAEWITTDTNSYPVGGKAQIIDTIYKTTRNSTLKAISDCDIFVDSTTCLNVFNAVVFEMPVLDVFIHVSGSILKNEKMLKVRIGTSIGRVIEECGGVTKKLQTIIINGVIKGCSAVTIDTPITKYVKAIRFLSENELPDQNQSLCVRCGRCHSICPIHLHPERIYAEYNRDGFISKEQRIACDLCTNCSLCNTVCPSRLSLSQVVRMLKLENTSSSTGGYNDGPFN